MTFTPIAADAEVTVKSRERGRWSDLYEALTANPNTWLAIPTDDVEQVRRAGKNSVQTKLDAESGPGGTCQVGELKDGSTVIRYVPGDKKVTKSDDAKPEAAKAEKKGAKVS